MMDSQCFARMFPLGSHLCREPMPPMSELKRDMENLKRHGFSLIKLQEHWMVDEPLEGHYDFSRYEELIAHAAGLEMAIYLGLTCEQAPSWLWRKYPDCRMVGRNGLPVAYEAQMTLPADGKPGPCYDHPGANADQQRFIGQLVRALGKYENVTVWNTWQEIAYWPDTLVGQDVCFCEHTLAHFRRWLAEKYGGLDGLNRAWNTRYLDWSYVQPNRGMRRKMALAQDVDWFYFMDNVQIAHVLRSRAEAVRAADPLGRPIFAHKSAPVVGSGQDWTYARCQDFVGSSAYPARFLNQWDDGHPQPGRPCQRGQALLSEMWEYLALRYDYVRSCNPEGKPVWAAEFQGGPQSVHLHKGRVPSPADMRRWMLTAVGSGVTAIAFWVTRAEIMAAEMNGFSLLDSGQPGGASLGGGDDSTPRYEEAARVGAALNQHAELFGQPSWSGADVGILVNEWNYQFCQSLVQGGEHLGYSTRGWHRLLWELGVPVDFVAVSGQEDKPLEQYKALILPFPVSLSEGVAADLARYVAGGGNLVSEAGPGRIDEHGYCNRGELSPGMAELFGVRQTGWQMVAEPEGGARWSPVERTWGEYLEAGMLEGAGPLAGQRVRANVYVERLAIEETGEGDEAEPVLTQGEQVAGVVRQVGEGRAWLLGTYVGHNGTAYRDEETRGYVRALLGACGVGPAHKGRLLKRVRAIEGKEAWLFTNPGAERVTERIDVSGWGHVLDLLGGPVERAGDAVTLTVEPLDIRVLVLTR